MQDDVRCLERLHATREHQDDPVGPQAELLPSAELRARLEDGQVDAGVDGRDAGRVGAVVADELAGLVVGIGHQAVSAGHHLRLTAQPDVGFRGVACGERSVLDPAEGMHGLHERDAPPFLGDRSDLAGQPVVAVHEVVAAGGVGSLGTQQLEGELAELAGKI